MFNSVKKAISGLFGARAVAKPRRNVIALPVEAPNNEEALVDARIDFLAVLEEILAGKKSDEQELIDETLELLHEGFCDGDYCTGNLCLYLDKLGVVAPDWDYDDARWGALAAAIEYAAGCFPVDVQTIEFALRLVESGEYRHIAETPEDYAGRTFRVEDDEGLGMVIADEKLQLGWDEWEFLEAFFDFEACGKNYREWTHGKFTRYGFFAEF